MPLIFAATMAGMKVVAYGSLMHRPSLEATLRRPAALTRITIPGWRGGGGGGVFGLGCRL
jgi:cation transport regulator ChaC